MSEVGKTRRRMTALQRQAAYDEFQGVLTQEEIAKKCGINRETLRIWRRSDWYQAEIDALEQEHRHAMRAIIRGNTEQAAKTLGIAADPTSEAPWSVKIAAATTTLRLGGIGEPDRVKVEGVVKVDVDSASLAETLAELANRLKTPAAEDEE